MDLNALRASMPAGSITSSVDYQLVRTAFDITNQITGGVLLAFSVFSLLATVAIVANLVTGIVISAYREIGIMKALGFTPLQVESVYVLQIVIPVGAASLLAIPLGAIASQPLLANSSQALGLAYQPTFSPALDALAFVGTLVIVTSAALLPALRAGRLRPSATPGLPRRDRQLAIQGLGHEQPTLLIANDFSATPKWSVAGVAVA